VHDVVDIYDKHTSNANTNLLQGLRKFSADVDCILGLDEACRGPMLGALHTHARYLYHTTLPWCFTCTRIDARIDALIYARTYAL
jgi:hypothetical protein